VLEEAKKLYHDGAVLIKESFRKNCPDTGADGLEKLLEADELSRMCNFGFLEPWKLFHAVSRAVLRGEELEKHIFVQQLSSKGNPEMIRFMEEIAAKGPEGYLDETLQRVTGATKEQQPKQDLTVVQRQTLELVTSCVLQAQQPADVGGYGVVEKMEERRRQATRTHNDACKLLEEGKHAEALRGFLAAVQFDPTQPKPHLGAAKAYVYLGDLEQAVQHAEMALAMAPEDKHAKETAFDVYVSKASKHIEGEDWVETVGWCRKAILVCPDDPEATNIFNIMYNTWDEKPGCVEPVTAACRAIVAKCPQWNYARYRLGRILLDTHYPEEAMPILREAVQREPTNAEYRDWLCLALLGVGQHDAAVQEYRILRDIDPVRAETLRKQLGPALCDPEDARNS